ncbi:MAG: hypothetical protein ACR2G4_12425 [Pyrinomonadaceae bacterium]
MRNLGQICATALLIATLSNSAQAEGWIVAGRTSTTGQRPEPTIEETKKEIGNIDEMYESILILLKTVLFLS